MLYYFGIEEAGGRGIRVAPAGGKGKEIVSLGFQKDSLAGNLI